MMTSPTGSKDLQMVNIGLRVLHRPEVGNLPHMYRQLGLDYDDRVLPSICNEVSITIIFLYKIINKKRILNNYVTMFARGYLL